MKKKYPLRCTYCQGKGVIGKTICQHCGGYGVEMPRKGTQNVASDVKK